MSEIANILKNIVNGRDGAAPSLLVGTVKKVEGKTCVITPISGDADVEGVRLIGDENNDGFLIRPSIGSVVLAAEIIGEDYAIVMYSQVDSIEIFVDKTFSLKNKTVSMLSIFEGLIAAITKITVPTPAGPSGLPVNTAEFKNILKDIKTLIK